jgi:disulfide bond formation protein DsbB
MNPIAMHRKTAAFLLAGMVAVIAVVLAFQHIGGYIPCKLCLEQRQPYYAAIPLALIALILPARPATSKIARLLFGAIAIAMAITMALAIYHAGVEWNWWLGPTDCGATGGNISGDVGDLLNDLAATRPPACDEAAGRFLGLSFAGWNVVVSAVFVAVATRAAFKRGRIEG